MSSDAPNDSFAALFEQSAPTKRTKAVRVGQRVKAVVIQVGQESVFVEIDGATQAFLEAADLRNDEGEITVKEGETIEANVVEVDDSKGFVRLARSMGKPNNAAGLEQAKAAGLPVEGRVSGLNKGGLEVEIGGVRAFCPMSQIDSKYVEDPKEFIGQTLRFMVTEVKDGGRSVVLSRRAALVQEGSQNSGRVLASVVAGAVLEGTVSSVRDFGAFVDLGGVEGMIPRSEISHDRGASVESVLNPGDVVKVQVREVKEVDDPKSKGPGAKMTRITLSLKALVEDPWVGLDLTVGKVVSGTVSRLAEFGAFVKIADAVDGLLHASEFSKKKGDKAPFEVGASVLVVVKKIDRSEKKISLGLANPGAVVGSTVVEQRVAIGSVVKATVDRIETYGVFVQVEGTSGKAGRGLIPAAETGMPRGTDLRKAFPEGSEVRAKVLETGDGKLKLSLKAAKDADERADFEEARAKNQMPKSLGTLGDLLKNFKK